MRPNASYLNAMLIVIAGRINIRWKRWRNPPRVISFLMEDALINGSTECGK